MKKIELIVIEIIYSNDISSNAILQYTMTNDLMIQKKEKYSIKTMWTQHSYNVKKIKQQKK